MLLLALETGLTDSGTVGTCPNLARLKSGTHPDSGAPLIDKERLSLQHLFHRLIFKPLPLKTLH